MVLLRSFTPSTTRMRFRLLPFLSLLAACARPDAPDAGAAATGASAVAPLEGGAATSESATTGAIGRVRGCSADARPGLVLTATDARSGAALAGFTVVLRVAESDGAGGPTTTLDSVTVAAGSPLPPPPITWAGASERAGRYSVRVTKAGYRPWDTTGVVVTSDECHVRTVRLDVRLRPE